MKERQPIELKGISSLSPFLIIPALSLLTEACNLSRNDTQMLIPNVFAPIVAVLGLALSGYGFLLLKNRNRK